MMSLPAIEMFVGLDAGTLQGRRFNLTGPRMFNGTYGPYSKFLPEEVPHIKSMVDSGAFQDPPDRRRTFAEALQTQLSWEHRAEQKWQAPFRHHSIVSYDLLIDEKWVGGKKRKERWTVAEADSAVRTTVDAAAYLHSQRHHLGRRRLVMACQGVDETQYTECAVGVLRSVEPQDIFGLGGWCILGRQKSWLPVFWRTLRRTLPLVARAGLHWVHLFGVLWLKPLGGLLWLADQMHLRVSTDSRKPANDCTFRDEAKAKRAGRRCSTWEENITWWHRTLSTLRDSEYYVEPPG